MTREEMEGAVRQGYEAWNHHAAAGTVAMCAPDCVFMDNFHEMHGIEEMKAGAEEYFEAFPDLRIELVSLYVDGNTVIQEWRSSGTHSGQLMGIPATGRHTEAAGAGIDEFGDDGLVHRSRLYWDTAKVLQDIGVMPAPAAATA
jgi:steroid delta-isomerase-like uncharacterized protein